MDEKFFEILIVVSIVTLILTFFYQLIFDYVIKNPVLLSFLNSLANSFGLKEKNKGCIWYLIIFAIGSSFGVYLIGYFSVYFLFKLGVLPEKNRLEKIVSLVPILIFILMSIHVLFNFC